MPWLTETDARNPTRRRVDRRGDWDGRTGAMRLCVCVRVADAEVAETGTGGSGEKSQCCAAQMGLVFPLWQRWNASRAETRMLQP